MSKKIIAASALGLSLVVASAQTSDHQQDWTNYVRIGAYSLTPSNASQIVDDATRSHVFGIEVDNDIPGRYESFLDPDEKLKAIRAVADRAHAAGNHAFVYIAGTECITANAANSPHTLAKDHPDWLQRKISGEPAIFSAEAAFWIAKGDEDVWVSPYAPEWRKTYMQRVKQIAETGIDGIYVDIPYWMTHFTGWEDSWASFDQYTVAEFKKRTGLDAKKDVKIGDFSNPNFQKWVDFRIQTFTDFMDEIGRTAKGVNPQMKIIPEIYPGVEQEAVRVGADVYSLYHVVDAIAHEYEFGEGDHMASSRSQLDWFNYQVGMHSFRAFAQGKATWILNYSWDGEKGVDPREAMKNLAMSQLMAGANFWDAPGHSMAGSNDIATRTEIFKWIAAHERTFYAPRVPFQPVGVYFSPSTRNRFPDEFVRAYRGILILLMQKHVPFEVVTPRTLADFKGKTLILPAVRVLPETEASLLETYAAQKGKLIVTGPAAERLAKVHGATLIAQSVGEAYDQELNRNFAEARPTHQQGFLDQLESETEVSVDASTEVATSIATVEGKPHVYLANFAGLEPHKVAVPTPQKNVTIRVARKVERGWFLPFLGEPVELKGEASGQGTSFVLPEINSGGVFWF